MRRLRMLVLIAFAVAVAVAATGCARKPTPAPASVGADAAVASASAPAAVQPVTGSPATSTSATAGEPVAATPTKPVSAASKSYAEHLGGVSQKGQTLYVILEQTYRSEAAATKALRKARTYFGDMQDYFIVQRSDNFADMEPGWWLVIESYRKKANAEGQLEFAQRAFPLAHIQKTTVQTADPIPVYEDLADSLSP